MKKAPEEKLAVPMSSMIDIVFLLLIYFIITSREEVSEAHLSVNLPTPGAAKASENKPKLLEVEVLEGELRLNGTKLDKSMVGEMLVNFGQTDPEMTVMVKVSDAAFADDLVTALDLCEKAGLRNLNVVSLK